MPCSILRRQIAIGRGDHANIGSMVSELPRRWNSRSWSTRKQLRLQIQGKFADFIQKQGASLRLLEAADAVLDALR